MNIDSIAVIELITVVEEQFRIRFENEDLVPETFSTLSILADVIHLKPGANADPDSLATSARVD